ncbi:UDP-3-O-acyl-N-acetylglucosamine deacetylase [Pseudoroseomonas globiformis]|uniref:UDP-3-O-acyl-N-acetylglucosamine deacetylase n=1 Tax=Teichococcus globiformis TaxID=2307229 RepID=A0ABV7G4C5_9PROT
MDGFIAAAPERRRTLKSAIGCVGVGLHSGRRASMTLRPAPLDHGIVFRRTDLGIDIPARFDLVFDTRLCTAIALAGQPHARLGTIEHVMAALTACGIDDALIEVDGPEVPILDGSAAPFLFLIDCAGIATTAMPRRVIEVLKTVRVQESDAADAAWAALHPSATPGFEAQLGIDFPSSAIGRQSLAMRVTEAAFRAVLANARTFTLAEDVARLRAAGLALGGSLDNAVVVDGPLVLNPGGLRHPDECVRHKLLDVVGDLGLLGAPLSARFEGHRSGHALNNRLARALMADPTAWRWSDAGLLGEEISSRREPVAA